MNNDHSVYLLNRHCWFFQSQDTCFVNLCSSDILRVWGLLRPRWKKSVYCSSTATWGHQDFYSIHSLLHSMEIYPTKPPSQKQNTKAIIVLPPCLAFASMRSVSIYHKSWIRFRHFKPLPNVSSCILNSDFLTCLFVRTFACTFSCDSTWLRFWEYVCVCVSWTITSTSLIIECYPAVTPCVSMWCRVPGRACARQGRCESQTRRM